MVHKQVFLTAGLGVLAAVSLPLAGQVHQIQGGNVLDASNRVGSGGLNPAARPYDFGAANRVVTGNVTGGRSFRGFSPVQDSSSYFLGQPSYGSATPLGSSAAGRYGSSFLPSDRLSNFMRDSYSVGDIYQGRGGVAGGGVMPYYSPSRTVTNTGAVLSGSNRPGSSQVLNPYAGPGATGTQLRNPLASATGLSGDGSTLAVPTRLIRANTGLPVAGQVNDRVLQNPLFAGAFREVSVSDLARLAQQDPELAKRLNLPPTAQPFTRQSDLAEPIDLRTRTFEAEDTRLDTRQYLDRDQTQQQGSSLDRVLERAAADGELDSYLLRRPGGSSDPPPSGSLVRPIQGSDSTATGPLAGAGHLFARMREMSGFGPQAGGMPLPGAPGQPGGFQPGRIPHDVTDEDLGLPPLQSFVGTEQSVLNRYLGSAEQALRTGEYYRAAALYRLATTIEPTNPLPYLGRSMALLAAGDYITSVTDLFAAIQLYDALGLFDLDLRSFIADLTVLDRRRADLEARLEVHEDYRLRFLLGYAEYCSGLDEVGLANLDKALRAAPMVVGHSEQLREAAAQEAEPIEDQLVREEAEQVAQTALTPRAYRSGKQQLFRRIMEERGVDKAGAKRVALPMIQEARGQIQDELPDAGAGLPQTIEVHPLRRFVDTLHARSASEAGRPTAAPPGP